MLESLDTLIAFTLIFTVVSMLITIVVQMLSSLFNLRGCNLAWGIAETFETINPGLVTTAKNRAKELADHLVKDSMLSDRQLLGVSWKATAVRPAELFDLMHRIASGKKTGSANVKTEITELLKTLGLDVDQTVRARAEREIASAKTLLADLTAAASALPAGAEKDAVAKAIEGVNTRLTTLAQSAADQLCQAASNSAAAIESAYQKFESWFETGQDRAQQWFIAHTKVITAIFSIVFAYWLQLDTVEIFKLVSTNRAVRDKLVAQAGVIEAQAAKVLGDEPAVLKAALQKWRGEQKDDAVERALAEIEVEVNTLTTRDQIRRKAAEALAALKKEAAGSFDEAVATVATERLKDEGKNFRTVSADFDQTGFLLFPDGAGRWKTGWSPASVSDHWFGIACSAGLLSLGAPFWFNLLKSMTNLRSTVAKGIEEEKKDEQRKRTADDDRRAPVTVQPAH